MKTRVLSGFRNKISIPFGYDRSYRYPREVWRPTRVEIRCAVGPGSVLLARASDPAEDPRPRPRRHTEPANGNTPKHRQTPSHNLPYLLPSCIESYIITMIISFFFFLFFFFSIKTC